MSDYDEIDLDEDELEDLYEDMSDPDDLTPEEVFKMVMLNKIKGTKVSIQLEDKDGDIVALADVVEGLIGYVKDKLQADEDSDFTAQIMPMMAQSLVSGLGRMIGIRGTAFYLAQEGTRHAMIYMMCVGFLLLKYVQEHGLLIHTYEEEVSEEEIEEIERKSKASSVATMGSMMGMDPREIMQQLVEKGELHEQDLEDLLSRARQGDEEDDGDKN
jgi:hypothetical protein